MYVRSAVSPACNCIKMEWVAEVGEAFIARHAIRIKVTLVIGVLKDAFTGLTSKRTETE